MFIASGGMKKHAAIAAAIVLVAGAGLWVWAQRDSQSADAPIPGTWDGAARQVDIPGVDFALDKEVVLIDATHAWAYVHECPHSYPQQEPCRSALGVSADGGKTWRRVSMPGKTGEMEYDHGTEDGPRWLPLNDTTVSLVTPDEIYVTRDQGKVWASYPLDNPPVETQRAANLADNFGSRNGDCAFRCPGISLVEPANGECGPVLTLLGTGPVAPQPKLSGRLATVQQGGDGRIWLTRVTGENEMRIAVSGDGGKSWQDLPPTTLGGLRLSPDGSKVIITHHIQQWRLDGQRWVQFPGGSAVPR